MLLSNLANTVTLLMILFEKSTETSIISAELSAYSCGSVPFLNVRVILQIMTLRLLSQVFHFSTYRPHYHSNCGRKYRRSHSTIKNEYQHQFFVTPLINMWLNIYIYRLFSSLKNPSCCPSWFSWSWNWQLGSGIEF